eukprot:1380385-Amphidinium_carterae.1
MFSNAIELALSPGMFLDSQPSKPCQDTKHPAFNIDAMGLSLTENQQIVNTQMFRFYLRCRLIARVESLAQDTAQGHAAKLVAVRALKAELLSIKSCSEKDELNSCLRTLTAAEGWL